MKSALVLKWNGAVPGREGKSLEFAVESHEWWSKQAADGKCSAPEMFFGQGSNGMWMVTGEADVLYELMSNERTMELLTKGGLLLRDWSWEVMTAGDGSDAFLARWGAAAKELADA